MDQIADASFDVNARYGSTQQLSLSSFVFQIASEAFMRKFHLFALGILLLVSLGADGIQIGFLMVGGTH